jgi:hypothetical protein
MQAILSLLKVITGRVVACTLKNPDFDPLGVVDLL